MSVFLANKLELSRILRVSNCDRDRVNLALIQISNSRFQCNETDFNLLQKLEFEKYIFMLFHFTYKNHGVKCRKSEMSKLLFIMI